MLTTHCTHCGRKTRAALANRPRLYCCNNCRQSAKRQRREAKDAERDTTCERCGQFMPSRYANGNKRKANRFCSSTCAGQATSERAYVDRWNDDTSTELTLCLDAEHSARLNELAARRGPHGGKVFDDNAERALRGIA